MSAVHDQIIAGVQRLSSDVDALAVAIAALQAAVTSNPLPEDFSDVAAAVSAVIEKAESINTTVGGAPASA